MEREEKSPDREGLIRGEGGGGGIGHLPLLPVEGTLPR